VIAHLFSTDVSPPLQTLNGSIDRVDEYDTTLFQPAHPELEEYDEEEGGLLFNLTNTITSYQLVFYQCHAAMNHVIDHLEDMKLGNFVRKVPLSHTMNHRFFKFKLILPCVFREIPYL